MFPLDPVVKTCAQVALCFDGAASLFFAEKVERVEFGFATFSTFSISPVSFQIIKTRNNSRGSLFLGTLLLR